MEKKKNNPSPIFPSKIQNFFNKNNFNNINKNKPSTSKDTIKPLFLRGQNQVKKNQKIFIKRENLKNENEINQNIKIINDMNNEEKKIHNKQINIKRASSENDDMIRIPKIKLKIKNNEKQFRKSQTLRNDLFIKDDDKNKNGKPKFFVANPKKSPKLIINLNGKKHIQLDNQNHLPNINQSNNFNNIIKNNLHNGKLILKSNQNLNNIIRNLNTFQENEIINDFFQYEKQNKEFRNQMEDFSYINKNFLEKDNHKMSLFAIFDGHGGKEVSEYLQKNFHEILKKNILKSNFKIENSIGDSFLEIDSILKQTNNFKMTGSTATIILIDNNIIYCGNVGDSSSFYITKDKIIKMTKVHNTKNEKEIERIKKCNGLVFNGKVYGSLSLTRCIGDFDFKDNGVIAKPTISKQIIHKGISRFVVLGSDGVWDAISKEDLFKLSLSFNNSKDFCYKIIKYSIDKGTMDNVSCIVIQF